MHKHHHHCHDQHSCCSEKECCSESSHGCGCGCGCSNCHCHDDSCCSSSKSCHDQCHTHDHSHGECCSHEGHILCLVKEIKHKLLKEKIAKQLETKMGKKLDELATVAVDAFLAEIEQKISAKKTCDSFRDKISDIFKG